MCSRDGIPELLLIPAADSWLNTHMHTHVCTCVGVYETHVQDWFSFWFPISSKLIFFKHCMTALYIYGSIIGSQCSH